MRLYWPYTQVSQRRDDTQHHVNCDTQYSYTERCIFTFMYSDVMLSVAMRSAVMQSVILFSVMLLHRWPDKLACFVTGKP